MYGFTIKVSGSFSSVIEKVTEELKKEGFGVLTTIDIAATLKEKLGVEKNPYHILGACNPQLASQALDADANIGLLLPCNVIVRQADDGSIVVGFMDPEAVLKLVEDDGVEVLAKDVRRRLQRVRDAMM